MFTLPICAFIFIVSIKAATPWMNTDLTPEERAVKLVAAMTFEEKMIMLHGSPGGYVGFIPENTRLGIPAVTMQDGPQGVGDGAFNVTCWPGALTVSSTFDKKLNYAWGAAMAEEQLGKGVNVLLGPMVNIARVPYQGRNFESLGEDPYLSAELGTEIILGAQDSGIIANVKHFANNNQELNRTTTSANIGQRAQEEIYFPAFKKAIENGCLSVMCGYNKVNDTWDCENEVMLNQVLKKRWGFKGFVVSDWLATHSTVKAANAGLDIEMPNSPFFGDALKTAVQNGEVSMDTIDDKVKRTLLAMFAIGLFDRPAYGSMTNNVLTPEHNMLARDLAANGSILLQNDGVLPLDIEASFTLAIIGDAGKNVPIVAGFGSGSVIAPYVVSIFEGISNLVAGRTIKVVYASSDVAEATAAASAADTAIVVVGTVTSEGVDRTNLNLGAQDALIEAVAGVQSNIVVVANIPGAILTPWRSKVKAILSTFMPGQEVGNAIAEILFGFRNPSGKLPITMPIDEEQYAFSPERYPGIDNEAVYSEGLLVGYRWFDAKNLETAFPFGHGLSYSSFGAAMDGVLECTTFPCTFTFKAWNSDSRAGAEVFQVYITYPESAGEPPKVLRGFEKVYFEGFASTFVDVTLDADAFSIFDVTVGDFVVVPGEYTITVGPSSRDAYFSFKTEIGVSSIA